MWQWLGRVLLGKGAEGIVLGVKDAGDPEEDRWAAQRQSEFDEQQRQLEHDRILEQHRESHPQPSIFDLPHHEPEHSTHDDGSYDHHDTGGGFGASSD